MVVSAQDNCPPSQDTNGDGFIGTADLTDFLSVFGTCVSDCTVTSDTSATNGSCGNLLEYWGYYYQTVEIGGRCWFVENLRTTQYRNGDSIVEVNDGVEWTSLDSGAQCVYLGYEYHLQNSGRLYNWYAVDDSRGLCPLGWHVPTDLEWIQLEIAVGMDPDVAYSGTGWRGDVAPSLKVTQSYSVPWDGDNTSGFSAVRSGRRDDSHGGGFYAIEVEAQFWSSTWATGSRAWARRIRTGYVGIERSSHQDWAGYKLGLSVRCIAD